MGQTIFKVKDGQVVEFELPDPDRIVAYGKCWGRCDELFTPAFWASQAWFRSDLESNGYRLGETILEEVAACLLGGHGIPAEVGLAAFARLKEEGVFLSDSVSAKEIHEALAFPLSVNGRSVRYRFARQKSEYLYDAFRKINNSGLPNEPSRMRAWLLEIKGVGLKTASWIVRNWLGSDEVAILDIHIHRAGLLAGFFDSSHKIQRHYIEMENRFIGFAKAIRVKPSLLDAIIWEDMKRLNTRAISMLEPAASPC